MLLHTFYEGSDFKQYPENAYIRSNDSIELYNLSKIYPHLIYAYRSKWWWEGYEKLCLQNFFLYNSGVFFSFGDNYYEIELKTEDLVNLSDTNPPLSFLMFYVFINKNKIELSNITIELDGEQYVLDITKAQFKVKTGTEIIFGDGSVTIYSMIENQLYIQIQFNLEFYNLPSYKEFKLLNNFANDDDAKVMIYDTLQTMLVYDKLSERFIEYSFTPVNDLDIMYNCKDFDYYLDKNLATSSDVLSLYLKPIFYEQDSEFIAAKALELHIEPVEQAYFTFANDKYKDIISIGAFHRLNPKTNHYRLFKNSVPWPAFTEFTLYKICRKVPSEGLPDRMEIPSDVYNYIMFPYPYQLLLLMYDYMYLADHLDTDDISEEIILDYMVFDIDRIIYKRDFKPIETGVIDFINSPISRINNFSIDGVIIYNKQKIPVSSLKTNITLDITTAGSGTFPVNTNIQLNSQLTQQ